ncbi:DUF4384 domain-containing protein [Desulfonema magnum]|uniref:DUF4384 n=1 Tax=Desulfonema magnum TaxID=45655 RepID=A0A975BFF3_9BACT|nr:DUF4384 domain-containing protein [Desulfonema magnum]QTA84422.1 DUF4384 [Desulfonema magnum]
MISKSFANRFLIIGWICTWFITACAGELDKKKLESDTSLRAISGVRYPKKEFAEAVKPQVHLKIFKMVGKNKIAEVMDGDVLTENDRYLVVFKAETSAYVYIFQTDRTGKMIEIFPNPNINEIGNPVISGREYRIPSSNHLFGLGPNRGKKLFVLLGYEKELRSPKKICRKVMSCSHRGIAGTRDFNIKGLLVKKLQIMHK